MQIIANVHRLKHTTNELLKSSTIPKLAELFEYKTCIIKCIAFCDQLSMRFRFLFSTGNESTICLLKPISLELSIKIPM